jgi:hypothetical protein
MGRGLANPHTSKASNGAHILAYILLGEGGDAAQVGLDGRCAYALGRIRAGAWDMFRVAIGRGGRDFDRGDEKGSSFVERGLAGGCCGL